MEPNLIVRFGLLSILLLFGNYLNRNKRILPHEEKHIKIMRETASECTLFLKKNNEFPIKVIP